MCLKLVISKASKRLSPTTLFHIINALHVSCWREQLVLGMKQMTGIFWKQHKPLSMTLLLALEPCKGGLGGIQVKLGEEAHQGNNVLYDPWFHAIAAG